MESDTPIEREDPSIPPAKREDIELAIRMARGDDTSPDEVVPSPPPLPVTLPLPTPPLRTIRRPRRTVDWLDPK